MTTTIPILMYHSVAEHPPDATRALSVRPVALAAQLRFLRSQGFTGLTFGQLCRTFRAGGVLPARPVVLTFDDGYADLHHEALPLLDEHGFNATLFVTTGWIDDAGHHGTGRPLDRMLSWCHVRELAAAGMEIGAHSRSHAQLDQIPDQALYAELYDSKALLEDQIGHKVGSFAYPYGYSSKRVREAVQAIGYSQAAVVGNAAANVEEDLFTLSRLTVRRSMSPSTFASVADRRDLMRIFAIDRLLAMGWSSVRRTRYAMTRVRDRG